MLLEADIIRMVGELTAAHQCTKFQAKSGALLHIGGPRFGSWQRSSPEYWSCSNAAQINDVDSSKKVRIVPNQESD